ncbi:unnamed protein product [Clonostachys byssicola]|uniref:ubiquitinyl hydrolase 1 n=1 Tax=Clonostachys byssicola TaxID=160290 RepID=A0A9N9Y7Z6_9HYPO|nr:unnamed protein product [Clonostachys byssicola]
MKEFPRKFLSLRDKNNPHQRSKSAPPGGKPRTSTSETFRSLWKNNNQSKNGQAKEEPAADKVKEIQDKLEEAGATHITPDHIKAILATRFADGDVDKTVEFIQIEQKAYKGTIVPYDPRVEMVGAENRGNVTCYLDSLLFAMFAKMDAFECVLKNNFPPEDSRHKLVNLLRIWVNMLRSGKLIRTDMMQIIQESLAECGWSDARELEQQDTSEAFAFITETLQLPLLSLQVDLFHHGRRDDDDHKVVFERLLNLAIPPDTDGRGIRLEDCLEEYFNARVDVLRDSEEAKKSGLEEKTESGMVINRNTIRVTTDDGTSSTVVVSSPVSITPPALSETSTQQSLGNEETITLQRVESVKESAREGGPVQGQLTNRQRSTSVIQNVLINNSGPPTTTDDPTFLQRAKSKGSTVIKAVTIPAWQFFRLIPWHAVTSSEPKNDIEVAMNFDQRPVVGICLKRYTMTESGEPKRHNTYIDIPDSLRLPHFMLADSSSDKDSDSVPALETDYKLVLQSVICHRGDSVQSGHYISFARVAPKLLTDNRRHDFDPPPDYEEAVWVRFDDLDLAHRVNYVGDIKEALKTEMPYLLFYQVVPMADSPSTVNTEPEPPSYEDFKASIELSRPPSTVYSGETAVKHQSELLSESTIIEGVPNPSPSEPPSVRLSTEDTQFRESTDATDTTYTTDTTRPNSYSDTTENESRRPSINLTESTVVTPAITPDRLNSPLLNPVDESTASRLSRAAARFASKGGKSRSGSQTGENRVSKMSRVAGLMMRPSKEPIGEPTALDITATDANERVSSENNAQGTDVPSDNEKPHRHSHNHKHGHRHSRWKESDKGHKAKSGEQPERECSVM